ncbi:MAG: Spore photoproduct lyase [Alphaproteobacteria bacterium MarineAlpha6_Bin5]|nr:MAG: Spore photoproduct lyase [Alphaproteobacteria bacterium MarineAlpha6_Bin5]|tara:strand:+ start:3616 stop:4611 length:996 start_codon:yes stop_codon:yes gene_type:complete
MIETIYIENQVKNHFRTKKILSKLNKNVDVIYCDHYGEIFNIKSQNFRVQKNKPALILAKKDGKKLHEIPKNFGIGGDKNYYFSHMLNCIYDCEYCFLQGKHMSAHYLLFINYEDFFLEIKKKLKINNSQKNYFFSGYDCDSLALDGITGFVDYFLPIFKKNKNAVLEIRTKSIQINKILKYKSFNNCVIAFSFTPENISKLVEHKVPSVKKRIDAMKKLVEKGWKIGLRFDPIVPACNFGKIYEELFKKIANSIPEKNIHSISFGMMRFPKKMFKKIIKENNDTKINNLSFENRNGIYTYSKVNEKKFENIIIGKLNKHLKNVPVFNCKI